MTSEIDPVVFNRLAWDREVEKGNEWTKPVSPDVIARARQGDWSIGLIGYEAVPRSWFPADLRGVEVLCLASGGGQQGPLLAAAGASVTVFDNSSKQLEQDRMVAERESLSIRTVLGDMRDLSAFAHESFDVIFNAVSNHCCPELEPVWRESYRVLKPAGVLLAGFMNPDIYIFDAEAEKRSELVVRHSLPYSDLADLSQAERERVFGPDAPLEYSHTLTAQIGGQLGAGFLLTGFQEAPHDSNLTARYMPGYFATRAVKPPPA